MATAEAKNTEIPKNLDGLAKEETKLREELSKARLDHSMQKLESPAKLRALRRRLARVLTMQRQLTKEQV